MKRQLDVQIERYTKSVRITTALRAAISQLEDALDMMLDDQEQLEQKINKLMEGEQ